MSLKKLIEANDWLTVLTSLSLLVVLNLQLPDLVIVLMALLAVAALFTNILVWQKRPPRTRTPRPRDIRTWRLALNILACLGCLAATYYRLGGI